MVRVRLFLTVASVLFITVAAKIRVRPTLCCKNWPHVSEGNRFFCYFVNYTQTVIAKVRQSLNDSESEFALQLEEDLLAKLLDTSDSQEMLDLLTKALDMQLVASSYLEVECPDSLLQGKKYTNCQKMNHDVAYSMLTLTLAIKEALELKEDQDKIAEFYQNVLGVHGSHRGDLQKVQTDESTDGFKFLKNPQWKKKR